jgi:hypothetical protein
MCNLKSKVIALITGADATIPKSFRKYVNNIPGKHDVKEVHETSILGTAHIFRKVLIQKYETFIKGNNITGTTYCYRYRRKTVTLYTTETWFVPSVQL